MNPKLIFLLLGILVKQTIDELKAIAKQNADELEKRKERLSKYPGNPAVVAGSMEHHRIVCEHEWANSVAPHLAKLTRWQRIWQYMPFALYLVLTIALFCYALTLHDTP